MAWLKSKKVTAMLVASSLAALHAGKALALDCESDETIRSAYETILCEQIVTCSEMGFPNAKAFIDADEAKIRQQSAQSPSNQKLYAKVAIATDRERAALDRVAENSVLMAMASKKLIKSIEASSTDYNKAIDRYECEAVIHWDVDAIQDFRKYAVFLALMGRYESSIVYQSDARNGTKNFELFYQRALVTPVKITTTNAAHFSVQSLRRGGVLVKLSDFRLPID